MAVEFLKLFGFTEDPFASTNAADEPLIDRYFVQPPFFPSVIGDPSKPKSNVVFAPRGGGKTAQKIMIERKSEIDGGFLCVAYDKFPLDGIKQITDADAEYHITNITRLLLVAVLISLTDVHKSNVDATDRELIVDLSKQLLGGLSQSRLKDEIDSIKSLGQKTRESWRKYGGAAISLVNAVLTSYGAAAIVLPESNQKNSESTRFKFEALVALAIKIGYQSVYILVDRTDELTLTAQNADKAFAFISPVLIDLPLLETAGVGFKFFLWDQMKEPYQEGGGRPDRLLEYTLDWSVSELEKVLERRLQTYSDGQVSRFDQLLSGAPYDVHRMISYFANASPRDMVRICKKIVDEHTKSGVFSPKIDFKTVKVALASFSLERARELYGAFISDLKKVGELTFTTNFLANDVFRIGAQGARAKVQKWQSAGAVIKIGELPNKGNRPLYNYGIVDPRLALAVLSDASLEEAMDNYLVICPHCKDLRIGIKGSITCPGCQGSFEMADADSLATVCAIA
ncbi:P-loop ATPase, Sll1717 family [Sphingomonas panacis]|uniref:P-loop ATPase, Sll1717 family n=1 Tax=Sphingomonas panacis TaxID=1560345 RepID=UPI0012377D78|nr:hypothetical protein [Sphingomonas panacis]